MVIFRLLILVSKILYFFLKLLPTNKNKVLFLSRQFNSASIDFKLVMNELKNQKKDVKIVCITARMERTLPSIVRFAFAYLRSLYELATSQVCVLDTYWPPVSLLQHKPELTVIQMWHATGKVKKSGYQTIDKPYGRKKETAETLKMHHGYDVVISGGRKMNRSYCESFNVEEKVLYNSGLPRLDYLIANGDTAREKFSRVCPEAAGKKTILYAPTFREGEPFECEELLKAFDSDEYLLIIRPHKRQDLPKGVEVFQCEELALYDLINACDYIITDYSATLFEAAAVRARVYFYLYDYEDYIHKNGLNIDPMQIMPEYCFENAQAIEEAIRTTEYDYSGMDKFAEDYLPEDLGHSTEKIAALIKDCMETGKYEGINRHLNRQTGTGIHMGAQDTAGTAAL